MTRAYNFIFYNALYNFIFYNALGNNAERYDTTESVLKYYSFNKTDSRNGTALVPITLKTR